MKIKNEMLYGLKQVFTKLNNHDFGPEVILSYNCFKFIKELDKHLNELNEFRRKLELNYFEYEEDGSIKLIDNNIIFKDGKIKDEYLNSLKSILDEEIEVNDYNLRFDINQLANTGLVGSDFYYLDQFIK